MSLFGYIAGCEELCEVQLRSGIQRPRLLDVERSAVCDAIFPCDLSFWLQAREELSVTRSESKIKSLSTSWSCPPSEQQGAAGGLRSDTGIQL